MGLLQAIKASFSCLDLVLILKPLMGLGLCVGPYSFPCWIIDMCTDSTESCRLNNLAIEYILS